MRHRIAADLVLVFHSLFAAFAVFGGLLAFVNPAWAWLHVPVALWSAAVNLMSWTCPLTPIEQSLRARVGQAGYRGGFIQHYIGGLVYPRGMPRRMELIAGTSVLLGNPLVYAVVLAVQ
jgi:hypothetical protein